MRLMYSVEKCVPVISSARLLRDERFVDVGLGDRHVGAVLAQEDQRERVLVLDAEHDRAGQPRRVDADVARRRSLRGRWSRPGSGRCASSPTREISAGREAEPRAAEGGVGRRAAQVLGEAGDVLEPRADLLRVEVDGEAAEADDVERPVGGEAGRVVASSYPRGRERRWRWPCRPYPGALSRPCSATQFSFTSVGNSSTAVVCRARHRPLRPIAGAAKRCDTLETEFAPGGLSQRPTTITSGIRLSITARYTVAQEIAATCGGARAPTISPSAARWSSKPRARRTSSASPTARSRNLFAQSSARVSRRCISR